MTDTQTETTATAGQTAAQHSARLRDRLTALSDMFERNVSQASARYRKHIIDETQLDGIPPHDHAYVHRAAERAGLPGSLLSLAPQCYRPLLCHASDRKLRQELYEAQVTRCSDRGPHAREHDNTPVILELLGLRHELALHSGLPDYAELALQRTGIFSSTDQAERFLFERARAYKPHATAQLDALWTFAKAQGAPKGFSRWDLPYYASLLQQNERGWDERSVSAYFPLSAVCDGLGLVTKLLFGAVALPVSNAANTGTAELALRIPDGSSLGHIRVELSRGATATDPDSSTVVSLHPDATEPRVELRCCIHGEAAEVDCLTPTQVKQLFSGWARGVVALLQRRHKVRLNVAAELAQQLAAALAWRLGLSAHVLEGFARHHQSDLPLAANIRQQLLQGHELHAAISRLDRVERALFALRVHRDYVPADKATRLRSHVLDCLGQVRREIGVLPPSYWERMPNTAGDIFGAERATHLWDDVWVEHTAELLFERGEQGASTLAERMQPAWLVTEVAELMRAVADG